MPAPEARESAATPDKAAPRTRKPCASKAARATLNRVLLAGPGKADHGGEGFRTRDMPQGGVLLSRQGKRAALQRPGEEGRGNGMPAGLVHGVGVRDHAALKPVEVRAP